MTTLEILVRGRDRIARGKCEGASDTHTQEEVVALFDKAIELASQ